MRTATPLDARLAELRTLLAGAGIKPKPAAKSFAALDKLGTVPPTLRALWQWADGSAKPIFFDATSDSLDDDEGLHFLSVASAAKTLARGDVAAGAIPFATDLAGNFVCVDAATGRVIDWDHETRKASPVAKSLDAFVAAACKALRKRTPVAEAAPADAASRATDRAVDVLSHCTLDKANPQARKQTIRAMNNPKAQGGDQMDDGWYLAELLAIAIKAELWAAVKRVRKDAGDPAIFAAATKLGVLPKVKAALK